jgi:ABC-type transport system substrate-binding protein
MAVAPGGRTGLRRVAVWPPGGLAAGPKSKLLSAINATVEPFNNKKVRQAIAWSIDRERFCKTVLRGFGQPTCLMWPTHSWAYFKDLEGTIGYDELAQILQADLRKIGIDARVMDVETALYDTRSLDMARRKAAARKLQEIALDECFTNPVGPSQRMFAYASYVKGFGVNMDNSIYVSDMWLEK